MAKPPLHPVAGVVPALFFLMFGGIGLVVLRAVWSDSMGPMPGIFRLVATFIALAFVIMGFGVPLTIFLSLRRSSDRNSPPPSSTPSSRPAPGTGYRCPHCGAALGQGEVSPKGDTKCAYCHRWWNIHEAPS